MAKQNIPWGLLVIVGAVLVLGGVIPLGTTGGGAGDEGPRQPGADGSPLTGNAQLIMPIVDAENGGGLDGTVYRFSGSKQVGSHTGTEASAANPTNLTSSAMYGFEVSTSSGNDFFYTKHFDFQAPESGPREELLEVYSIAQTLPEITVYKSDDITANTTSARQAIGTNDERTFRVRFRLTTGDHNVFSDGVSPPNLVCEYDGDHFNELLFQEGSIDGSYLSSGIVPNGHSTVDLNRSTKATAKLKTNPIKFGTNVDLYITAKSGTTQPANDNDENGAIWCTLYDGARMKDNTDKQFKAAYRNLNTPSSDVGAGNWEFALYYS